MFLVAVFCTKIVIIYVRHRIADFGAQKPLVGVKARFHYERKKKHSLFVLLLFFALASILTARFNQRSIKETKNALFHTCSENGSLNLFK